MEIFFFRGICLLMSWTCTIGIWSTLAQLNLIIQIYWLCYNAFCRIKEGIQVEIQTSIILKSLIRCIHLSIYSFIYPSVYLFIYPLFFHSIICLKNVAYWWWRGSEYNQKIGVRLLQAILLSLDVLEIFSRSRTCLHLTEPSAGCQSYASLTNTANPNVSWTNLPAMLSKFASAVIGSCLVSLLSLTNYTWISFQIFNYFFRRRRYEYWWIILDTNNCFNMIPQVLSNSVLNIRSDVETILFQLFLSLIPR